MARQPREFGVPSFELLPDSEPMGFRQSGLFPAGAINILQVQQRQEAVEAAKERITREAREAVETNAEWDKDLPVGPVVKPQNDNLRGYKRILKQGGGVREIMFSPRSYTVFDGIVAKQGGIDPESKKYLNPAFNPEHPHFDDYAGLRRNLAILRDYLLVTLLPNGNKDDPHHEAIQQMAAKLGKALANEPSFIERWKDSSKRLLEGKDLSTPETNPFREAANIPDTGIAVMYDFLFDRRDTPVSLFSNPVEYITSKPWPLVPREQTPFSEENLLLYGRATVMEGIANAFEEIVKQTSSVESLTESDKKISVEHAQNILDKLRILVGNRQEETNVDVIEDSKRTEAELLLRAAMAYKDSLSELKKVDPNLLRDPTLKDAHDAMTDIDYLMKVEATEALREEGRTEAAQAMSKRAAAAAPKRPRQQSISSLVSRLARGYSQANSLAASAPSRSQARAPSPSRQSQQSRRNSSPAQQAAMQVTTGTFSPGSRIRQVSNPALMLFAQHINDHSHDHDHDLEHDPHAPLGPGKGPGSRGK